MSSDVAEALGEEVDFVVAFGFTVDKPKGGGQNPICIFSTRSHTDFECIENEREWHITLNQYQRDNLVWLFAASGYGPEGTEGVEPFTFAQTGDWAGEIPIKLDYELGIGNPNHSLEQLQKDVDAWKQRQ